MRYSEPLTVWAENTFSGANLGDHRLTRRLVDMAAAVASRPGGTVTGTMATLAQREGAYRFLASEHVKNKRISQAVGRSTALACGEHRRVFVAVDQSDLTFMDRKGIRGLGPDCTKKTTSLGSVQVMSALAMDERGVPIGILDQHWWLRSKEKSPSFKQDKRPPKERESWLWLSTFKAADKRLRKAAVGTTPWYVFDRGADYRLLLRKAIKRKALVTVRAAHNRRIVHGQRDCYLFTTVRRQPVVGTYEFTVPRGANRPSRLATLEVRMLPKIEVKLGDKSGIMSVVRVREIGYVPKNQERICWTLLTTYDVTDFDSACAVIHSYRFRWRIEEFHKTWKTGACKVERSQLRNYAAITRWATILAAVAARIERLKRLSRESPELDALTELSQEEIDAAIIFLETKKWSPGDKMNLREAVRLVAMVGGYMGRKGDGPPGSITIRRGLERVGPAAKVLRSQRCD